MKRGETVVVATKNAGKVREFAHAFGQLGIEVVSMFDYPALPDVVEDGTTFAENARKKAREVAEALGLPVLADDSGLEVAALGGEPGVYSARYSGEGATDERNNEKLLRELARTSNAGEAPERLPDGTKLLSEARFVCALALYDPAAGTFAESEGDVAGYIMDKPRGDGGFGYDPLFWVAGARRGMAEMTKEEKQAIGHRGQALARLLAKLEV
ncbi:RdgB/HAM1 family non-canonical purine NTP pyrophosphatase [Paenibacillus sacheonensis]|uniref:dITP/XTP pyrophosphatase n=1 Tax=Paenibacillus sacheonensis TaxID=742054 RepID=A0A7X5BUX3_9BACL|nr:RdgB/HAM1 family non-canonical purine NTP pyrophosphatase [Paenibacillus sacheonensis]MBM7563817.1 XTP/dITP diphosphohydrolase [Paenibacillus sacheonensis]NBC67833.1 RdgB/HAM1 family non-canonical purine NTP pyrophosphatase [Paenibacillus sacheonensis]